MRERRDRENLLLKLEYHNYRILPITNHVIVHLWFSIELWTNVFYWFNTGHLSMDKRIARAILSWCKKETNWLIPSRKFKKKKKNYMFQLESFLNYDWKICHWVIFSLLSILIDSEFTQSITEYRFRTGIKKKNQLAWSLVQSNIQITARLLKVTHCLGIQTGTKQLFQKCLVT